MSMKIYKQLVVALVMAALSFSAMADESKPEKSSTPAKFYFLDNVGLYFGVIDETVNDFISAAADKKIERLYINSQGGDAHFGIIFGHWVYDNQIEVEVPSLCMSACANYVFTAAKTKIIRPSALVIWHGSAEQWTIREMNKKYEDYLALSLAGKASKEQIAYLDSDKLRYEGSNQLLSEQRQFFKKINVNEYITRLGHEPVFYKRVWVATVGVMNKMNIQNISAPEGYGNIDYLKKHHPDRIDRLVSFGLNSEHEVAKLD
ncbi:hypothetical protein UNDKW_3690 [Undibacterium sp. KW1]|uniref:hypothetical protein n=1 Tax=Undibacterium sp. KW1 TaxID=2058624 RepID=UPI001331E2E2|nr:hypothetical protein [Undibacterium sp. KW1]BBB61963.1 hypothetical protein UNDKW_3690 [Undibacterium sp. KW1]